MSTIRVTMDDAEGALVRLLGLVERRGWRFEAVDFGGPLDGERKLTLSIAPRDAGRNAETLKRQLERLVDVRTAELEAANTEAMENAR
ncbi:MAG: ACT domain-containing protein [Maricaulaceae bacterium]